MRIKQTKVLVDELVVGMYISGLDRPWTQTPFPLQGFYVREDDDLRQLKRHCRFVYIDTRKGRSPLSERELRQVYKGKPSQVRSPQGQSHNIKLAPIKIRRNFYSEPIPLSKEVVRASQVYDGIADQLAELHVQLVKGGAIDVPNAKQIVSQMVDSVLSNPDALGWLVRVQKKNQGIFEHCFRAVVWALIFGRFIGLDKRDLNILAFGVLFKDVGKIKLPDEILLSDQRDDQQQRTYEGYVELGVELLRTNHVIEPKAIEVVRTHQERINGSGFPRHLSGDKIPLLGKIAGLAGFYDEVTNPRVSGGANTVSPSKAVACLYERRSSEFQEDLVLEFIRAVGLYPIGSLVALNTGEVGVVVEQNYERRLKPKVMLVLAADGQALSSHRLVDLAAQDKNLQAQIDQGKKKLSEVRRLEIARDLEPGKYNVNVAAIRDDYLFGSKKLSLMARIKQAFGR